MTKSKKVVNPFRIGIGYNPVQKCWEIQILIGGIASEADAAVIAKAAAEWIAGPDGSFSRPQ